MDKVRFGIIGLGGMGRSHADRFKAKEINNAELTAVADIDPDSLDWAKENLPNTTKLFDSADKLYDSGEVDAVLISTPHYDHPPLAISGLEKGLHVLSEKPAGVYTKQVNEMNAAADKSEKVFGLMFNQRTKPVFKKMRDLVQGGELGEIIRVNIIVTDWFRSQNYYDNGGWRGTWEGEGGGVLLNQCPHNLDLWQWICGMPKRMMAFANFGRLHNIEVEDEVTAYVEYENGASGVFIASTGESPGTNRFEIAGDRGKLLLEGGKLTFHRTTESVSEYSKITKSGFKHPENWCCVIPASMDSNDHGDIINDFVNAIMTGSKLLAPGQESINSLQLSNAMLLSAWTNSWVALPVDEDKFYTLLKEKIANSTYEKPEAERKVVDVAGSF